MIITNKLIFIHLPKNGGTFISHSLRRCHRWINPYDLEYKDIRSLGGKIVKKIAKNLIFFTQPLNLVLIRFLPYFFPKKQLMYDYKTKVEFLQFGEKQTKASKHNGCDQIPTELINNRLIFACIRNPFTRYISMYTFQWWKLYPLQSDGENLKEIDTFEKFMTFYFNHYTKYFHDKSCLNNALRDKIGPYSLQFIEYFVRKTETIYAITDVDDLVTYCKRNLYPVEFIHQENLNQELLDLLNKQGIRNIDFIKGKKPVNVSNTKELGEFYTRDLFDLVLEKEALLFNIFPEYNI